MPQRERISKIDYGQDETSELAQCDHKRDRERRALGGQHKHGANAHVLRERVAYQIEPDERHRDPDEIDRGLRGVEQFDLTLQVFVEECKHWQC